MKRKLHITDQGQVFDDAGHEVLEWTPIEHDDIMEQWKAASGNEKDKVLLTAAMTAKRATGYSGAQLDTSNFLVDSFDLSTVEIDLWAVLALGGWKVLWLHECSFNYGLAGEELSMSAASLRRYMRMFRKAIAEAGLGPSTFIAGQNDWSVIWLQ